MRANTLYTDALQSIKSFRNTWLVFSIKEYHIMEICLYVFFV